MARGKVHDSGEEVKLSITPLIDVTFLLLIFFMCAMKFKTLETVALARDLPEHGLRRGDLGAIAAIFEPDALEVEFVRLSGRTQALVTLQRSDVRPVGDDDLMTVRKRDE